MDDPHFPLSNHLFKRGPARRSLRVLVGALLEDREDARLVVANAGHHELRSEDALTRARRAGNQYGVTLGNAPAEHPVQLVDVEHEPFAWLMLANWFVGRTDDDARKYLNAFAADPKGVQ